MCFQPHGNEVCRPPSWGRVVQKCLSLLGTQWPLPDRHWMVRLRCLCDRRSLVEVFMTEEHGPTWPKKSARQIEGLHVRLPGFMVEEPIGLGDVVKQVSYVVGIKPCGGCEQRAAALNRWVVFGRK